MEKIKVTFKRQRKTVYIMYRYDYFIYDETQMTLTGERTKTVYRIGDDVKVRLVAAKPELGQLDFAVMED